MVAAPRVAANGKGTTQNEYRQGLEAKLRRGVLRSLVQDFSPFWFTWCMNSGILALLMHSLPYQFSGLSVISTVAFMIDFVLFVTFSAIFIARFLWFRKQAYDEIVNNVPELLFCACWPIAWLTLCALVPDIVSNAKWGGHAFTIIGYIMWWIGAGWSLLTLFWSFITLIRRHDASDRRLPMLVILPAVSISTVAVTGAQVASMSYQISSRLAVPIIISSFLLVGGGVLMGLILTVYLFHSLLTLGWPAAEQTPTLFIFIGPMAQSAAALQALGESAYKYGHFAAYNKGTFITAEAAGPLNAACVLIALLLTGLGILWAFLSLYAMIEQAVLGELKWAPGWNSIIFPIGTLNTAMIYLAEEMDSPAFRVISTGMLIILIIVYLVNVGFTTVAISKGKLLIVREDPRIRKQLDNEEKER